MPDDDKITVTLTVAQMRNILAAYEALRDKSPFFAFNLETRHLIEHLQLTLAAQHA